MGSGIEQSIRGVSCTKCRNLIPKGKYYYKVRGYQCNWNYCSKCLHKIGKNVGEANGDI